MRTLDATEPLTLDDGEYRIVRTQNPFVQLRRNSDGALVEMNYSELSNRAVGMRPQFPVGPRAFDRLNEQQQLTTHKWLTHLEEIITGLNPKYGTPRPEYDLSKTTQNERIESKVKELRNMDIAASRATIMRRLKALREEGRSGVIDRRMLRRDVPLSRLDVRVREALVTAIANQPGESTGTRSRVIHQAKTDLFKLYGPDAPALPPLSTLYRYLAALTKGKHTFGSAKTRSSLANRPTRSFTKTVSYLPGMHVQVDSTPMDIEVMALNGKVVRPVLTIMLDVATRSIIASTIRLVATKGFDHALLLAQSLTPPMSRPSRVAYRQLVEGACPSAELLSIAEREQLEHSRPFIAPRRITIDNGKDYISDVFMAAAERYGVHVVNSAIHTPTDKAHVERMFGTINTMFTQYLPGYVGRSPEFRGTRPKNEKLLTVEALYELFDDWVLNVWQRTPHSGLTDPHNPTVKVSPNEMLSAAQELTATLQLPLSPQEYIELLPVIYRRITAVGVKHANREFDADELHPLRNTKSDLSNKDGKWEVKHDSLNPLVVWVHGPDGAWIECHDRGAQAQLQPHAAEIWRTIRDSDRADVANVNAALTGIPAPVIAIPSVTAVADFEIDFDAIDGAPVFDPAQN